MGLKRLWEDPFKVTEATSNLRAGLFNGNDLSAAIGRVQLIKSGAMSQAVQVRRKLGGSFAGTSVSVGMAGGRSQRE